MTVRGKRIDRRLGTLRTSAKVPVIVRPDAPRLVRNTLIDFSRLPLPADVTFAFAEAFWGHLGARAGRTIRQAWTHVRTFCVFATESHSVKSLADLNGALLGRYIEWLNKKMTRDGHPWRKATRFAPFSTLCQLLQWIERCRPNTLAAIEYPINPFPGHKRDAQRRAALGAHDLNRVLQACERDIAALRTQWKEAQLARAAAIQGNDDPATSLGALLEHIDRHFDGILPMRRIQDAPGGRQVKHGIVRFGGFWKVGAYLYPTLESLLPYYLALLIHTGGNPDPIAALSCDCLQSIPLLDDRQLLVWDKPRAGSVQRRSFRSTTPFEPPALVRDLLEWTKRLRPHATEADRDRLILYKTARHIGSLPSSSSLGTVLHAFARRHGLPPFTFVSIRPSVLTAYYRRTGDLREVRAVANHAQLSTTVRYVRGREVDAQNRAYIGGLQTAFIGHIERARSRAVTQGASDRQDPLEARPVIPRGHAVTMFGFNCKDPYGGIAPGSRKGELCPDFLGCFTCRGAVIPSDPKILARLLQARDHLRASTTSIHPARWNVIYAPVLHILEEDILTRFSAQEIARATGLRDTLPPLPDLR